MNANKSELVNQKTSKLLFTDKHLHLPSSMVIFFNKEETGKLERSDALTCFGPRSYLCLWTAEHFLVGH